jgi:hypothetical protein
MRTIFLRCHFLCFILIATANIQPSAGHAQSFPLLSVMIEDSAATEGYYFLTPYTSAFLSSYDHAQLILDKFGRIIFYRIIAKDLNLTPTIDFKLQPNGWMSYYNTNLSTHFIMDSTFTLIDSVTCTNGFQTNQHDLQILPDNHYLFFGNETRIMNLTSYHYFGINHTTPGGANAQVTGVVIQEFNEDKELVWEWKAHDHYQFGDVDPVWLLNPNKVDWTHANAVEKDHDGNILVSLRHFNEITKIDYSTGNILWRLGGKQNQFAFPNDPIRFTGQHDIRRVSDTSVSLFDNGQYTNPPMGRAVEYSLDESNKIATLVWEYIYDSSMYSGACGNHQYIENGNHLVDFGFTNVANLPWMVVVKPDKSKILEIGFPDGYISYRAFNYPTLPWQLNRPNIGCQKTGSDYYLVAEPGHPEYRWSTGDTTSSIQITGEGDYWVFVPYGSGYLSSEHMIITDLTNPCLPLGAPSEDKLTGISLSTIPNPATDHTRVLFHLPSDSQVTMSLSNLMGVEVLQFDKRNYPAGNHEIMMDVSALSRGIYFLTMVVSDKRVVGNWIISVSR